MAKPLKKKGKKIENQYGVKITVEEQKHLVSLVNSVNRKAKRIREEYLNQERLVDGIRTGQSIKDTLSKSGKESDFLLSGRSKSIHKYKDKYAFNREIKRLEKVVQRDYLDKQAEKYKKNFIKAVRSELMEGGTENVKNGREIINAIKKMDTKEYFKKVQGDETMEIRNVYSPDQREDKVHSIMKTLDLKHTDKIQKDEEFE